VLGLGCAAELNGQNGPLETTGFSAASFGAALALASPDTLLVVSVDALKGPSDLALLLKGLLFSSAGGASEPSDWSFASSGALGATAVTIGPKGLWLLSTSETEPNGLVVEAAPNGLLFASSF
jgi:hypothetical protein